MMPESDDGFIHEFAMQMPLLDLGVFGCSREGAAARAMGIPSFLNSCVHSNPRTAATSALQAIRLTQCDAWWRGWAQGRCPQARRHEQEHRKERHVAKPGSARALAERSPCEPPAVVTGMNAVPWHSSGYTIHLDGGVFSSNRAARPADFARVPKPRHPE